MEEDDGPTGFSQFREGVESGHRPRGPDLNRPRCTSMRSSPHWRTDTVTIQP